MTAKIQPLRRLEMPMPKRFKLPVSLSEARDCSPPQTATTVSVREGKRQVQDGPYAETKEFLAGFAIIDVPNLDLALEWAARHPAAARSAVEVRPLVGSLFPVGARKPS